VGILKMNNPIISIITPSLNQASFLEETILSIIEQECPGIEYMIIDGGSTDGSIDIIRRHSHRLAYWESVKDRGQADAINKGFSLARGELLGWINSDDLMLPGGAKVLIEAHRRAPHAILLGDVINIDAIGKPIELIRQKDVTLENLIRIWRTEWAWHQPGTFFPRSLWEKVGPMDTSLRYLFDREWLCRAIQHAEVFYLRRPVCAFRIHPLSKTVSEALSWKDELYEVGLRYRHLVPGVSEAGLRAGCHLNEAILYITRGSLNERKAALKAMARAIRTYPEIGLTSGFLRNILRAFIPGPLLLKMRASRRERSLRDFNRNF